jgi:hypothetical protein
MVEVVMVAEGMGERIMVAEGEGMAGMDMIMAVGGEAMAGMEMIVEWQEWRGSWWGRSNGSD